MEKNCKVIALRTEDPSIIWYWAIRKLWTLWESPLSPSKIGKSGEPYHLYMTTEDTVYTDDWYMNYTMDNKPLLCHCESNEEAIQVNKRTDCFKVIASTDCKLKLPLISKEFLTLYVINPVDNVLVEYIQTEWSPDAYVPISNENNTIKIRYIGGVDPVTVVAEKGTEWIDKDFIIEALNAYWNDATDQLNNGGKLSLTSERMPLGDLEKDILHQRMDRAKLIMKKLDK